MKSDLMVVAAIAAFSVPLAVPAVAMAQDSDSQVREARERAMNDGEARAQRAEDRGRRRPTTPATQEQPQQPQPPDRPDRPERPQTPDHPQRPDRPDHDGGNRPDRSDWTNDRQDHRSGRDHRRRDRYGDRHRFNSDRWHQNWYGSHSRDWWRHDHRFRSYSGLRMGFYFAPGYGYYSVPRSYWGRRWREGDYLPSMFWRYQLNDWRTYGLGYPPAGTRWVVVDNQLYLIDERNGYIVAVIRDAWRW